MTASCPGNALPRPPQRGSWIAVLWQMPVCLILAGCLPQPADNPGTQPAANPAALADRECWYATYVMGAKAGYQHYTFCAQKRDGRPVVLVDTDASLEMKRGASRIAMNIRLTEVTTAAGALLEFQAEAPSMTSRGKVEGDELRIETTTRGKTVSSSIPWSPDYGGFSAVDLSLLDKPMEPGEKRTIRALVPLMNHLGTTELVAKDFEQVELLSGSYDLLRIDAATRHPDGRVTRETRWTDRTGQVLKIHTEEMDIEAYLTTAEVAQDKAGLGQLDFNFGIAVPVDRTLSTPHRTRRVRYRATLQKGDPASVFVSGPSQQVRPIDAHTAEVTVVALRPDSPSAGDVAVDAAPGDDAREPSNLVQSDDPKIVAAAKKATGGEKDPWQAAIALERFVNGYVTQKDFTQAFATASEVMESRQGDCSEHAVLLAALCRAAGIPARGAVGLVYQNGKFYFHMWTEVYVGRRWTAIDATLARGGIGAAHLKLAHSNLQGSSAFSAFLPVAQVLGRGLKIEIVDVQ